MPGSGWISRVEVKSFGLRKLRKHGSIMGFGLTRMMAVIQLMETNILMQSAGSDKGG